MSEQELTYTLSDETKKLLNKQKKGCFLCKLILKDDERNGQLTGYPVDMDGKETFPVDGKLRHIELEKEAERARKETREAAKRGK